MQATKKFNLMELFTLVDGRLSYAGIGSLYKLLGHICNEEGIMTHHLPVAANYLKECKPTWYIQLEKDLKEVQEKVGGDDFEDMMSYIKDNNKEYEIPQLPAELLTNETFGKYMVDNSLLLRKH